MTAFLASAALLAVVRPARPAMPPSRKASMPLSTWVLPSAPVTPQTAAFIAPLTQPTTPPSAAL